MSDDTAEKLDRHRALKVLAALSSIDYDKVREESAEQLGCRVSTLDAEVKALRKQAQADDEEGSVPIEDLEPHPEAVVGLQLYTEVKSIIERHMDLPAGAATSIALWIFGTYCYDQFALFPKLLISSPEKECGKSTLMEILESLTHKPYLASNGTEAAIFRLVDVYHPALLLDETDRWVTRDKPGLIGIINCGHTRRGAKVLRTVGDDHTPKNFSVWGPMALAGIRKPADTIVSRSIQIELRRMPPGVRKEKTPMDLFEQNQGLRRRLMRWAEDEHGLNAEEFAMPDVGGARERDNWAVMLKIAARIGALDDAISAFQNAVAKSSSAEATTGIMLLADIQRYFREENTEKIWGKDLVGYLTNLSDRPWSDWKGGFTQNKLAKQLEPYDIKPKDVRIGETTKRGYDQFQFQDAFLRYLPATQEQGATTLQARPDEAYSNIQSATDEQYGAPQKAVERPSEGECSTVALQTVALDPEDEWND